MKIKRKVQMNLPQLIEYIFANNLKHKWKNSDNTGGHIHVYDDGKISVEKCTVDSTFTIEVEEEIDEDTEIDRLVVIDDDDDLLVFSNYTIKEIKNNDFKEYHAYIDGEFKLIWTHEKGLVE